MKFFYILLAAYFSIFRQVSKIIYVSSHLLNIHHGYYLRNILEQETICLVKGKISHLVNNFTSLQTFLFRIHDVETEFFYFSERYQTKAVKRAIMMTQHILQRVLLNLLKKIWG